VPKTCAILIGLGAALFALPAAAHPYLMLNADDHGFRALDLGGMDRSRTGQVQATVIDAPLAGVQAKGVLAPLVEQRVEIDCATSQWRMVSTTFLDGQEKSLASEIEDGAWEPFGADEIGPTVQAAACRREYRQQAVSRYLKLGEILASYQAAHAKAATEPQTEKELLDRKFRNSH
jgi:hypothetical protein